MKLNSIRTKLLIVVISAFLLSTVTIFVIADKQLTQIIDTSQNELYGEKVDAIWRVLFLNNERLKKTGLIEAYLEDFQKSTLKDLRHTYYTRSNLPIYPFILDTAGDIVMHPILQEKISSSVPDITENLLATDQGSFKAVYNNQLKYYTFKRFPEWQWVVAYAVPMEIKYADARHFRNLLIMIMGVVILVILLVLTLFIYRFTKPITILTHAANAMAEGKLDQEIEQKGSDEIISLGRSFNHMREAVKKTITELEHENAERRNAEEKLSQEKEQLAVTLRSIGEGVVTTDVHGNIILMNKEAEQLIGRSRSDAIGSSLSKIFPLIEKETDRDDFNIVEQILKEDIANEEPRRVDLLSKDDRKRTIACNGAAIRDEQNQVIGAVMVLRDITAQLKIEEELHKNKKLESIGVLAGGVAHDFNNLLAAILGNIDLVLLSENLSEKAEDLLTKAVKASIRAKGLTQQLLTFSKGGSPVKEMTSLKNVIVDSANFCLHGQHIACQFCISEDLWPADVDKDQIAQVIQNIVINAAQAMSLSENINISAHNISDGQTVDSSLLKGRNYIQISIADSGEGIPEDHIEKIFDPFFYHET